MDFERLASLCSTLKGVSSDIKWGDDLCYSVAGKIFCSIYLKDPYSISFKVTPEQFAELIERNGIIAAPYTAKNHWVQVQNLKTLNATEWKMYIHQSYQLVFEKLSKK